MGPRQMLTSTLGGHGDRYGTVGGAQRALTAVRDLEGLFNQYPNKRGLLPSSVVTKHTSLFSLFPTCLNGICYCRKHRVYLHNSYVIQT